MSYGQNNRNFPALDRIFPEEKIQQIWGENLDSFDCHVIVHRNTMALSFTQKCVYNRIKFEWHFFRTMISPVLWNLKFSFFKACLSQSDHQMDSFSAVMWDNLKLKVPQCPLCKFQYQHILEIKFITDRSACYSRFSTWVWWHICIYAYVPSCAESNISPKQKTCLYWKSAKLLRVYATEHISIC